MNTTPPAGRGEKAILDPDAAPPIDVRRYALGEQWAQWADYIWIVRWHAASDFTQRVIPQPIIHVAAEDGRLLVHGVGQTDFARTLSGDGIVVGVAFRPGGFHGLLREPVSTLSRSVLPAAQVLGVDDSTVAESLCETARTDTEHCAAISDWLAACDPEPDGTIDEIAGLVTSAEQDPTITRAEQLASMAGVSLRTLQRQFGEYVGIGPKWVIARFRLLDAAAAAHRGAVIDWAATAAELGFADQAHLTRAFTALVGAPPATYQARGRAN